MIPIEGAMMAQHQAAAEKERARRREEEELMTGYSPGDLQGNWQFKIVRGTFKRAGGIRLDAGGDLRSRPHPLQAPGR